MKIRNFRILKIFRINAIVIWPFILFADKEVDSTIINHERIHWDQIKRDGILFFYSRYIFEYLKGRKLKLTHDQAYRNISYEREAYTNQNNIDYKVS